MKYQQVNKSSRILAQLRDNTYSILYYVVLIVFLYVVIQVTVLDQYQVLKVQPEIHYQLARSKQSDLRQDKSFFNFKSTSRKSIPFNQSIISNIQEIEAIAQQALQQIQDKTPKVALLFLISTHLPLEPLWRAFFYAACNVKFKDGKGPPLVNDIPIETMFDLLPEVERSDPPQEHLFGKQRVIGQSPKTLASNAMMKVMNYIKESKKQFFFAQKPNQLVYSQHLFSPYVHLPYGKYLPIDSIFSGYEVPIRADVVYAQHSLVLAELSLIHEALKNPLNQRFVLLSESCSPLYPPELIYTQLMFEDKSRVRACNSSIHDLDQYRWSQRMETNYFKLYHWRKSRQWFGLTRAHAKLLIADKHVEGMFQKYCFTTDVLQVQDQNHQQHLWRRICISDEHYIPTALAVYNQDDQTACNHNLVWSVWVQRTWSPVAFGADKVSDQLIQLMRSCERLCQQYEQTFTDRCDFEAALGSLKNYFKFQIEENVSQMQGPIKLLNQLNATVTDAQKDLNKDMADVDTQAQYEQSKDFVVQDHIKQYYKDFKPLFNHCPLFGRKFLPEGIDNLLDVGFSCQGIGLHDTCYSLRYSQ